MHLQEWRQGPPLVGLRVGAGWCRGGGLAGAAAWGRCRRGVGTLGSQGTGLAGTRGEGAWRMGGTRGSHTCIEKEIACVIDMSQG